MEPSALPINIAIKAAQAPLTMTQPVLQVPGALKLQRTLSLEEWARFRPIIHDLYIIKNLTIPQVAQALAKDHGFQPTWVAFLTLE
jgi:hypothetical protein